MEQTYEPSICKPIKKEGEPDVPPLYSGTVTLRRPNYDERLSLLDSMGIEFQDGDTEETVAARAMSKGRHLFIRSLARRLPEFFVSANIVRLSDGAVFSTLEDMQYDSDMNDVITGMCTTLIGKYSAKHPGQPS